MSSFNTPRLINGLKANVDLSTKQYHAVKIDTSTGNIVLCGAGGLCIGFLQNKPLAGDVCEIATTGGGGLGISAETMTAGVLMKVDASGHLVAATADGEHVAAISVASSVDNDVFEIMPVMFERSVPA